MPSVEIFNLYSRQLVWTSTQEKLECHREDSIGSRQCPIYTKPIKESLYLSFTEQVSLKWLGGKSVDVKYPSWWESTYNEAKLRWITGTDLGDKTLFYRFHGDKPLGSVGNVSGHAGGVVLNFFTGLSIKTQKGVKCLVTRPFNSSSPVWTMQDGIYDTDVFPGDFSVNFLMLLQNQEVVFQRGEPFASLLFFQEVSSEVEIVSNTDLRTAERQKEADRFYIKKTGSDCPYHKNIGQ